MADTISSFFALCWGFFGIEFELFGYVLTLRQVLLFSVAAFGVAYSVIRLLSGGFGGDDE